MNKIKKIIIMMTTIAISGLGLLPQATFADMEFSVSPMNQKIVLIPNEEYDGTFNIANPVYNKSIFYYKLSVEPFYVDENYQPIYENNGDYSQIVNWITLENETGSVAPNQTANVHFRINVPENAPAGGQYAIIRVSSDYDKMTSDNDMAVNIQNIMTVAHILYAEVAGETERNGEIFETNVPSFLLSGNITGSSAVKNTGNVHSTARYTLQVFPLFSGEEVYTNEESPLELTILPDRTLYNELAWENTPPVGIFNVIYTVEFEGVTTQVSKMVIICPIWLMFIIFFVIFVLVIYFVMKVKNRKKAAKKPQNA